MKIADELMLDARMVSKASHRSITGQIEFWAQLGEAVESLLQGAQVLALLRANAARPLSECLKSVDSAKGRQRVADYLETQPFPHYEPAPHKRGHLVRTDADGKKAVGRFINRKFVVAH